MTSAASAVSTFDARLAAHCDRCFDDFRAKGDS